jgi:CRP-like cAMP-binding protein
MTHELAGVELFKTFAEDELDLVTGLANEVEWEGGDEIYAPGEPGGSMFVVLRGAIELFGTVGGVEKLFMTIRDGGVFGLLTMLDEGVRPSHARALEKTRALALERAALDSLLVDRPAIGIKILQGVGKVLGQRVRTLTAQYDATLAWNLEVTGLASLNLERLMSDRIEVSVETLRGEPLTGTLVRFEQSSAGHELYLLAADRRVHVVPYHAIVRISVDETPAQPPADLPTF